jgi:signal transduction histidine kinase
MKIRTSPALPPQGAAPLALLLLAVLVPTAAILWLMNEAVESQTVSARQSVIEAYRGQLRYISRQINTYWQSRAAELDRLAAGAPAASFRQGVAEGRADSLVLLDPDGGIVYPSSTHAVQAPPGAEGSLATARALLLDLSAMKPDHRERSRTVDRLVRLLNDYDSILLPSSQRLFLMSELVAIEPSVKFPTHLAEGLAADYVDAETPRTDLAGLRQSRLRGVWQIVSTSGRVVGLYTEETVHTIQHRLVDEHQSDMVRFAVFPPGEDAYEEAIAVGAALPGWQASFTLLDVEALDHTARARTASYLWVGALGIGLFAIVALGVGHRVRRHIRLSQMKTDLVAAVSHELRTPLASMRLLVDSLLQDERLDPVKTREYLDLIAVENGRLSRLIDNFLTFSRLERNRYRFSFAHTPPAEIAHAAVEAMRERLHPGCEVEIDVAPGLPLVKADADALVTALLNLLDNAHKYTPADKRIALRVFADGRRVVFAVQDNGIGIPAGEQRRIFRRFYRVDRRLSRDTAGVGLGLSIVSDIVRAHGGSVHVTSQAGAGSTFAVHVPALAGAAA